MKKAARLKIEYMAIADLRPYSGNARTHSKKQITQIAVSIAKFGFNCAVLVDGDNCVIAGHGRLAAAGQLGMVEVPVVRLEHMSDAQRRAFIIAENRLAELAGWDPEILRIELQYLSELDLDFEIEITGFETSELDQLLLPPVLANNDPADDVPNLLSGPAISQIGDIWIMGSHRLLCGNARDPKSYQVLMAGELARVVVTDPPYNRNVSEISGLGKKSHPEFLEASGEMSKEQFSVFLQESLRCLADASVDGAILFAFMDWRHMGEMLAAGAANALELKNVAVWNKTNAGMGSFYRSKHEFVFIFKHGTAPHMNNFGLGETGRYRTNVWDYPGANAFKSDRDDELDMHPTVKNCAMFADAIKDVSRRNDIVLDGFGGSGTTLIAAETTRRKARLIELDPRYCDVICRRFTAFTGKPAILAETGQTFDAVMAKRLEVNPLPVPPADLDLSRSGEA